MTCLGAQRVPSITLLSDACHVSRARAGLSVLKFCDFALIPSAEDYERMMDNIEEVAALYPMIEEWDIFRDQVRDGSAVPDD